MKKRTNFINSWKVAIILMVALAIGFMVYTTINPWPSSTDLNPPSSEENTNASKVPETVDLPVLPKLPETVPPVIPNTTLDDQGGNENKSEPEEIISKPSAEETSFRTISTGTLCFMSSKTSTEEISSTKPADKPKEETSPEPQADTEAPFIFILKYNKWSMLADKRIPCFFRVGYDRHDGFVKVIVTHDIKVDTAGEYTVTFTATDKAGNTSTLTHVFEVKLPPTTSNQNGGNTGNDGGGTVTPPPVDPPKETLPEVSEGTENDNGGENIIIGGGGLPGTETGGLPNENVSGGGLPPEASESLPTTGVGGLPQEEAGQPNNSGNSVAGSNATSEPTAQQSDSAENEQMTV